MKTIMRKALTIIAIVGLVSGVSAQGRTWVVNGIPWEPKDFTDLPPAFAAASPGDTIVAHAGILYSPVSTSKGVNVVATPNWNSYRESITVTDLPAGQTLRIAGLSGAYTLRLHRCAGTVHLQGVFHGFGAAVSGHGVLEVIDCSLVTLNNCWIVDMTVERSTVAMTHSAIEGWVESIPYGSLSYPALRMTDSDSTASDCWFRANHSAPTTRWPAVPAIEMRGGTLRLASNGRTSRGWVQGAHVHVIGNPVILSPAIQSDGGVVVVDPDMVIPRYDGPAFSGSSQVITEQIPFLTLQHLIPGSAIDCHVIQPANCPILDGQPGAAACILVSLPAPPLPTPFGDFWLHQPSTILVGCGTIDPAGELRGTIDFRSVLRTGDATTWQGVVLEPSGRLQLTHPVVPVLGIF